MNLNRKEAIQSLVTSKEEGTISKDELVVAIEAMFETIEADVSASVRETFARMGLPTHLGGCTERLIAA